MPHNSYSRFPAYLSPRARTRRLTADCAKMACRIMIRSSLTLRRPSAPRATACSFPAATLRRCIRRRHALAIKVAALPRRTRSLRSPARAR